ncbi:UNVERIFIED_CONTAM: hypothetical protein HDU68_002813, partial [Siphonaria sp. JEL0065]
SLGKDDCESTYSNHCCHNQASTRFQIDFDRVSLDMAHACLAVMNQKLTQNMGKLDGSVKYDGQSALPEPLEYAVLYWSNHFVAAFSKATTTEVKIQLLEDLLQFCQTELPMYLEAVLLLGQLNTVVGVVGAVLDCLTNIQEESQKSKIALIRQYLTDLKFIAFNFRPQLLVNPLQVYRHALIAVPQDTLYYKTYSKLAPLNARLTIGHELEWGPFTLYGHTASVNSVALSADGRNVVSGSSDNSVKVWDLRTGECTQTLTGHTDMVYSVAISTDGETIVSGSRDKTVKLWDIRTSECTRTLTGHTDWVRSVAISTDGETIVSGSDDKTVKVWDIRTGICVQTYTGRPFGSVVQDYFNEFSCLKVQDNWIIGDASSSSRGGEEGVGQGEMLYNLPLGLDFKSSLSTVCWKVDKNVACLTLAKETDLTLIEKAANVQAAFKTREAALDNKEAVLNAKETALKEVTPTNATTPTSTPTHHTNSVSSPSIRSIRSIRSSRRDNSTTTTTTTKFERAREIRMSTDAKLACQKLVLGCVLKSSLSIVDTVNALKAEDFMARLSIDSNSNTSVSFVAEYVRDVSFCRDWIQQRQGGSLKSIVINNDDNFLFCKEVWVDGLWRLREVFASFCGETETLEIRDIHLSPLDLEPKCFKYFGNLTSLVLSHCQLKMSLNELIPQLPTKSLKKLDLSHNALSTVGLWENPLENVEELVLCSNRMHCIDLSKFLKLRVFHISDNYITEEWKNDEFSKETLETIFVQGNLFYGSVYTVTLREAGVKHYNFSRNFALTCIESSLIRTTCDAVFGV